MSLDSADINNDLHLDLFSAEMASWEKKRRNLLQQYKTKSDPMPKAFL